MDALCPDCENELTPSIVGYLCHNCGSIHQFDRVSKRLSSSRLRISEPTETSNKSSQKSSQSKSISGNHNSNKPNKFIDFIMPRISSKNATTLNPKK